jgi:UDP-glucose 4-epimerase
MDGRKDYGKISKNLSASPGLSVVEMKMTKHSTCLDNAKAKLTLGWRPGYGMKKMMDSAWDIMCGRRTPPNNFGSRLILNEAIF